MSTVPTLAQTTGPLETLRGTPEKIAALLLDRRRRLHKIAGDTMISALAMQQQTDQVNADSLAALESLQQAAESAKARLDSILAALLSAPLAADPVLAELRAVRLWDRQRALLAGGWLPEQVIAKAAAGGDRQTLAVLRAELPAWIEAGAPGEADQAAQLAAGTLELLDQAEYPLLNTQERVARDLVKEVELGYQNILTAFNYARSEVTGPSTITIIPDWARGTTITVSESLALNA